MRKTLNNNKNTITANEINKFLYCPYQWYYGRLYGNKELRQKNNTINTINTTSSKTSNTKINTAKSNTTKSNTKKNNNNKKKYKKISYSDVAKSNFARGNHFHENFGRYELLRWIFFGILLFLLVVALAFAYIYFL